jgi:hydrogenase maturation protein HypF
MDVFMSGSTASREARRISIRGIVQGVGFRPLVYRTATCHEIAGWVLNGESGVEVHAEGSAAQVNAFLRDLKVNQPVAARISSIDISAADPQGYDNFQILESFRQASPTVPVSPDLAVCDDCLREMNDPANRRHRFPYINCTNCGPRYSIIQQLPYDRVNTTMAAWKLCDDCQREYDDPHDRRHHAQPIACGVCGPGYQLVRGGVLGATGDVAICEAAELLRNGGILAVKGIGGYHLACDAANAKSVAQLRTRKFRKNKPFAVMLRSLEEARKIAELTVEHERLLTDVSRPIVLGPAKVHLPDIAPDTLNVGVMLPYAPLHFLLFESGAPSVVVMTSANRSNEPIAYHDEDALDQLSDIADAFLVGQRPIARRVEDSVITIRDDQPFMIRRSRGSSPGVVATLPTDRPILAVGADLKNSIALVVDGEVIVSQHIGDLDNLDTYEAFEETVRDLLDMYAVDPAELIVAHDLHPQFRSTRFAKALPARHHVAVQHHHAHVASVLAEHKLFDEPVVGVALDGTGYGTDGSIWGGEFFFGSIATGFEHCAALRPIQMPGGDAAVRFPVQAAAGFLAGQRDLYDMTQPPFCFPKRFVESVELVNKNVRCLRSTSAGRLFDAVAAILGFTREVTFEGQAAIWLETQAHQSARQQPYAFPKFDHQTLLKAIIADRLAGRPIAKIAFAFHAALAQEIVRHIVALCAEHDVSKTAMSGGVFQNELLRNLIYEKITRDARHVEVFTNCNVPVNDGGICLGQAAAALARYREHCCT